MHEDLWDTLKRDWVHVRAEARPGWKHLIRQTFAELEEFYLTPADRDRLAQTRRPWRWFLLTWWLLTALLLKLTPTRRVVLVVALALLWNAQSVIRLGPRVRADFDTAGLGAILVIGILLFELRDKLVAKDELRAVQMSLMPSDPPALAGWDIWMYTRPANDVGGDLVDSLELQPGRLGIALADVAGKALPAALLMAKVQSTLRALATDVPTLGDLAARTNQILCRDGLPNRFATMVYLDVRADSGLVRLLNAGHMPPMQIADGRFHQLPLGNMALGLVPHVTYHEHQVDLAPGDTLLVYSDGVTEALNAAGEFFGDERLLALVPGVAPLSARNAGLRILDAVDRFIGECKPYDDLSIIVIKRR